MEELVKMVSQKAGISQDQAKTAVATVLSYLNDKLPAPIGGQIDSLLGGGGDVTKNVTDSLGGFFNK